MVGLVKIPKQGHKWNSGFGLSQLRWEPEAEFQYKQSTFDYTSFDQACIGTLLCQE